MYHERRGNTIMFYVLVESVVVGVSKNKPNTSHLLIESEENWPIGSSYINGVFGEPIKTYAQELAELNADKEAKEDDLAKKMSKIRMRNGAAEEPTVTAMRSAILTKIDSDYVAAKTALKLKHFGA
jgi:hypothetical protein